MSAIYIKLGPKAASFYDFRTKLKVSYGEVVKVSEAEFNSSKVQQFVRGGGIIRASEDEYQDYQEYLESKAQFSKPKPSSNAKLEALEKSNEELNSKLDSESQARLAQEKLVIYYKIQAEYELEEAQLAELEKIKNNKAKLEAFYQSLGE